MHRNNGGIGRDMSPQILGRPDSLSPSRRAILHATIGGSFHSAGSGVGSVTTTSLPHIALAGMLPSLTPGAPLYSTPSVVSPYLSTPFRALSPVASRGGQPKRLARPHAQASRAAGGSGAQRGKHRHSPASAASANATHVGSNGIGSATSSSVGGVSGGSSVVRVLSGGHQIRRLPSYASDSSGGSRRHKLHLADPLTPPATAPTALPGAGSAPRFGRRSAQHAQAPVGRTPPQFVQAQAQEEHITVSPPQPPHPVSQPTRTVIGGSGSGGGSGGVRVVEPESESSSPSPPLRSQPKSAPISSSPPALAPGISVSAPPVSSAAALAASPTPASNLASEGGAAQPQQVISNSLPDLLCLLNPAEHAALMNLLRNRIDGKNPSQTLVLSDSTKQLRIGGGGGGGGAVQTPQLSPSHHASDLGASPLLPPLSPNSGSLRRPSMTAGGLPGMPPLPPGAGSGNNLESGSGSGPTGGAPSSPSRTLHFAPDPTVTLLPPSLAVGSPSRSGAAGAGPSSPPTTLSPPPPAPGSIVRGRSKSFSSRSSLPRRPSLQSVREEGGLAPVPRGLPLPPAYQNGMVPGPGSAASSTAAAGGPTETAAPAPGSPLVPSGKDRPRANSLFARPLGSGGLIALPASWSRQGSGLASASSLSSADVSDDDQSDTEGSGGAPPAAVAGDGRNSPDETSTPIEPSGSGAGAGSLSSRAPLLSLGRSQSASGAPTGSGAGAGADGSLLSPEGLGRAQSAQAGMPDPLPLSLLALTSPPSSSSHPAGRRGRHTMHAAQLKHLSMHSSMALMRNDNTDSSEQQPSSALTTGGRRFDSEREENGGQYWSLSHASLLLERVALEKALPPLLADYLSQALEYIGTARAIVKGRMSRRGQIEEQLRAHPEQVATWLGEFAKAERKKEEGEDDESVAAGEASAHPDGGGSSGSSSGSSSRRHTARSTMSQFVLPLIRNRRQASGVGVGAGVGSRQRSPSHSKRNSSSTTAAGGATDQTVAAGGSAAPPAPPVASDSYESLELVLLLDPVEQLLHDVDEWSFDLFALDSATGGHSLLCLAMHLLQQSGVLVHFPTLDLQLFYNFFRAIESGYHPSSQVPYHNAAHGADVLQGMYYFLRTQLLLETLTPIDVLAGLVAAACHDYDHPGKNNAFLIATGHPLAVRYNDQSVLESHHAAASWALLTRAENDWLSSALDTKEERAEFRATFCSAILHTDMSMHTKSVAEFESAVKAKRARGDWFSSASKEDRKMLIDMACHVSDLGNPAKPFPLAREWTLRVVEEFYRQGDAEAELGLKISPMCDRSKPAVEAQQYGFICFVVEHLFNSWAEALTAEAIQPCLHHLAENKEYYRVKKEEIAAAAAAAAAATATPSTPATSAPSAPSSSSPSSPATPSLRLLPASDVPLTPWKNGLGRTRQLALFPPTASFPDGPVKFLYRLSSALLEADAPCSTFEECERLLLWCDGGSARLLLQDGESEQTHALAPSSEALRFGGSLDARIELDSPSAPATDVGLIFRRGVQVQQRVMGLEDEWREVRLTLPSASSAGGGDSGSTHHLLVLLRGEACVAVEGVDSASWQLNPLDVLACEEPIDADAPITITRTSEQPAALWFLTIQLPREVDATSE